MNLTQTITTVDVAGTRVVFHCAHDDGTASWRVVHDAENVTVYLHGTAEQMGAFADVIVRGVSEHLQRVQSGALDPPAGNPVPRWNVRDGDQLRWCFVCEAWVRLAIPHTHGDRTNPWVPKTETERRQDSFHCVRVIEQ
ncbi:MAG TPA: hypothetical protein VFO15_18055 [Xanthobacteraceae bacterium]|nr:hypothetical protein [Xanthobacteraceae bacterium]